MSSYQGNARLSHTPRDYREGIAALGGRDARKIGNNTTLVAQGNRVAVILHRTAIVTFHSDGRITLATGGWNTPTTRGRINAFIEPLGWHLFSKNRKPKLVSWTDPSWKASDLVDFYEDMALPPARPARKAC